MSDAPTAGLRRGRDAASAPTAFIVMNLARPRRRRCRGGVSASFQKDPQVLIAHPDAGHREDRRHEGPPDPAGRRLRHRLLDLAEGRNTASPTPRCANTASTPRPSWPTSGRCAGLCHQRALHHRKPRPSIKPKRSSSWPTSGYPGYAAMVLASLTLIAERSPRSSGLRRRLRRRRWKSYLNGDRGPGRRLDPQGQSGDAPGCPRPGPGQDEVLWHRRVRRRRVPARASG